MNQGRFVFSQLTDFVPRFNFNQCVDRYDGHRWVKSFSCFDQFLSMSFGQLSCRESLRDIVNCLNSQRRSLYHLGFSSNVSRSTLAEANEKRDWNIYRDFAQVLICRARHLYFNDKEFSLEIDSVCYVVDSSVIDLCLSIFPWAKMRTVRAAIKLNMQLDLSGNIPVLFSINNARKHDLEFLDEIELEARACYILDRGYTDFKRLFKINEAGASFVIRAKTDLGFRRVYSDPVGKKEKEQGIRCDQIIRLTHWKTSRNYPEKLRRVKFFDEESKRYFVYLTNDLNSPALTIARLYKYRWQIELFFKWIKQHLKIKSFWGRSENAVKTQICIAICTYLLVAIAKKELGIKRDLYEILQILNVTLLTKNPIDKLLSDAKLDDISSDSSKQACLLDF